VNGKLHAPAVLPSGKEPPVPIGEGAEWAPDPFRTLCRRMEVGHLSRRKHGSDDNMLSGLSSQLQGLGSFVLNLEEQRLSFTEFLCVNINYLLIFA
jgi:hypothetical protein